MLIRFLSLVLLLLTLGSVPTQAGLIFSTNASWKLLKGRSEASSPDAGAWRAIGFDDSGWTSTPAPFWYGDVRAGGTQLSDMLNGYSSFFLRRTFVLTNLSGITSLRLTALIDDGFIAWVNGTEVQRVNMAAGAFAYNALASTNQAVDPAVFNNYDLTSPAPSSYLVVGTNVLAVQVFNTTLSSSDIGFEATLNSNDGVAPGIAAISPPPGAVTTLTGVTVTFSEPVQGVNASDLLINGAPATGMSGGNDTYTFTFAPQTFGTVQMTWAVSHGITDYEPAPVAFDATAPDATWTYTIADVSPPVVVNVLPATNTTVRSLRQIEIHFSEDVSGVDAGDLLINGSPATNVIHFGPGQFVFEFTQPPTGAVQVAWSASHGIQDLAATPNNFAGGNWSYILDPYAPLSDVRISEFLASNNLGLRDEDGDASDWIELFNPQTTAVNLNGWALTDDPIDLGRWHFPNVTLPANSYLLVFASAKDRTNPVARLHTNFKLEKNGDYLALVDPAGNISSQFYPKYPAQQTDVSYGRDLASPQLLGYYTVPTPGAPNNTRGAGFAPDVGFSRAGGSFVDAFSLLLTAPASNAVIRYTIDGTVPTNSSPIFSNSIPIAATTQVRARAFVAGLLPGAIRTEIYLLLNSGVLNASSDLPIVVLHNFGGGTIPATFDQFASVAIFEPVAGRTSLTNPATLSARAGLNIRGSSTQGIAKQSFAVEFWDEFNDDKDYSVLGMPAESDWVLYAPNNFEPVLIHNPFMYELSNEIGRYAPRTRFVEVYVNTTGGPITAANYNGVYAMEEKIKRNKDRVDIDRLQPENTNAPSVTGGYLLKIDRVDADERAFSAAGQTIVYQDPDGIDIQLPQWDAQEQYIINYFTAFGTALNAANYTDPTNGYAAYVDVASWIDHHILNVMSFNVDALRLSGYFHKPRNEKINMGPVWDFDRTLGSTDGRDANPRVWRSQVSDLGTDFFNYPWWGRMFTDPNFWQRWIDRWQDLRKDRFSTNNIYSLVDTFANTVREAQVREVAKWPSLTTPRGGSYQAEVNLMKNWLSNRLDFIDGQFVAKPTFSNNGGPIAPGFTLTITGPPGTIYYTIDGTDPRASGGGLAPNALVYSAPIVLNANARVVARVRDLSHFNLTGANNPPISSPWSGLMAATYIVATPPIVITEIMYHPQHPPAGNTNDADGYEFIELKNIGTNVFNLTGIHFTNGIDFDFTGSSMTNLAVGQYVVIVKNRVLFSSRYPAVTNIAGEFAGNLDNDGERISLVGRYGEPILDFSYNDSWYPITDGLGFSLVMINETGPLATWGDKTRWRVSGAVDGSPGTADPSPPALAPVLVNEALTHTDPPLTDSIELFNPTTNVVDLGGWFISDDFNDPRKYRIPVGTQIQPSDFMVFNEAQFNPSPVTGKSFSLSSKGDQVYLFSGNIDGNLTGYYHGFRFGASENGVSFGRYLTSVGKEHFVAQQALTLGGSNSAPKNGPVVVSEIMYHPPDLSGGLDNQNDEYVELYNVSGTAVALFDAAFPSNTWKIRGGVDFTFPTGLTLPSSNFLLLVSFDPTNTSLLTALRNKYGVSPAVPVFGPYSGKLDNDNNSIELYKPDSPDVSVVPYVLVDKVEYSDSMPWPAAADGLGPSLHRKNILAYGNDPVNWAGAGPSPGAVYIGGTPPVITTQPTNQTVLAYNDVTFNVAAVSSPPVRYQWRFNGASLAFGTNPMLVLSNAQPSQAGNYSVVVIDASGSVESSNAVLTLLIPANITQQPQSQLVRPGSNVTFRVLATSTTPIAYQWRLNGTNIPSATGSNYTILNAQTNSTGSYTVVLTDGVGSVFSATAELSFLFNPVITQQPASMVVAAGSIAIFQVSASGTLPITCEWRRSSTPVFTNTMSTNNVARFTFPSVQTNDAGSYRVVLKNAGNLNGVPSAFANLIVAEVPVLTNEPISRTVVAGTNVTFTVGVRGVALTYLWFRNGALLAGQTNSSLNFTNVQIPQEGTYFAIVTNVAGSVTSTNAVLILDSDRDGIPDSWEVANNLNPFNGDDNTRDSDHDGMTNLQEYIAGTDPQNPLSYLKVEQILVNGTKVIQFNAVSNKTYSILYINSVTNSVWLKLQSTGPSPTNRLEIVTDASADPIRYYRLVTPQQ